MFADDPGLAPRFLSHRRSSSKGERYAPFGLQRPLAIAQDRHAGLVPTAVRDLCLRWGARQTNPEDSAKIMLSRHDFWEVCR
uniref:hypothetical protein n=1 Tax=Sphingomonas bacterium TaxID=1895847 RepID=UPI00262B0B06